MKVNKKNGTAVKSNKPAVPTATEKENVMMKTRIAMESEVYAVPGLKDKKGNQLYTENLTRCGKVGTRNVKRMEYFHEKLVSIGEIENEEEIPMYIRKSLRGMDLVSLKLRHKAACRALTVFLSDMGVPSFFVEFFIETSNKEIKRKDTTSTFILEFIEEDEENERTFRCVWERQYLIPAEVSAVDADGNKSLVTVNLSIKPNLDGCDPDLESKKWPGRFLYNEEYIKQDIYGIHGMRALLLDAAVYATGGAWIETCRDKCNSLNLQMEKEDLSENKMKKLKTEFGEFRSWGMTMKQQMARAEAGIALVAILCTMEKLNRCMLVEAYKLELDQTYNQNSIGRAMLRGKLWNEIGFKDPNPEWPEVKFMNDWLANPKRTLLELLNFLETMDITKVFCKAQLLFKPIVDFVKQQKFLNDDDQDNAKNIPHTEHLGRMEASKVMTAQSKTAHVTNSPTKNKLPRKGMQVLKKKKIVNATVS